MNQCMKMTLFFLFLLRGVNLHGQIDIQKVLPLNWSVGMLNPNLQILIYGETVSKSYSLKNRSAKPQGLSPSDFVFGSVHEQSKNHGYF